MTVEETAAYLRSTPRTIYQWSHEGRIPKRKVNGKLLFMKSELDQWILSGKTAGPVQSKFQEVRERLRSLKTEETAVHRKTPFKLEVC
jgi:excisionase family DNA binding protein